MIKKNVEEQYNNWHKDLAAKEEVNAVLNHSWYVTVKQQLPTEFNGKILEIGCGRGDFSIYLANKYPNATVLGTDFSESAIAAAKTKIANATHGNLDFKQENAEQLTFDDQTFDLIISCETMEHVFHPQYMANEIHRVLKSGGKCILTTENYFNGLILSWLQTWILNKPFNSGSGLQPHENFMLNHKTLMYFKKSGFEKVRTMSNHFQWLVLPKINPARLCTEKFKNDFFNRLFKPFGRHFTYFLTK